MGVRKLDSTDEEIRIARQIKVKYRMLGWITDGVLTPSSDENIEYLINRDKNIVTITDATNKCIVMHADIGEIDEWTLEQILTLGEIGKTQGLKGVYKLNGKTFGIYRLAKNIYIVGVVGSVFSIKARGKYTRLSDIPPSQRKERLRKQLDKRIEHDTGMIKSIPIETSEEQDLYERIFLCLDGKAHRIVQFMHRDNILIADIGEGESNLNNIKRMVLNIRENKIIANGTWSYADRRVDIYTSGIIAFNNSFIVTSKHRLVPNNSAENMGENCISIICTGTIYDYAGGKWGSGGYRLTGAGEDFIRFDRINNERYIKIEELE
jgi:hypothetical protein